MAVEAGRHHETPSGLTDGDITNGINTVTSLMRCRCDVTDETSPMRRHYFHTLMWPLKLADTTRHWEAWQRVTSLMASRCPMGGASWKLTGEEPSSLPSFLSLEASACSVLISWVTSLPSSSCVLQQVWVRATFNSGFVQGFAYCKKLPSLYT